MSDLVQPMISTTISETEKEPYRESEIKTDGKETEEDTSQNKKLQLASTKFAHRMTKERIFRGMLFNSAVRVDDAQKIMRLEFKRMTYLSAAFPDLEPHGWVKFSIYSFLMLILKA